MATEDARYRTSTQYRFWSFSPAVLRSTRARTNELTARSISARLAASGTNPPPPSLTPDEEVQMLNFFVVELLRASAYLEQPTEVRASAAVFLRRFYTTNSIMTYPPMDMLKTCLFFGAKAEGHFALPLDDWSKHLETTPAQILAGEYLLCQGIRFAFDVRHPFRALEGAVLELRRLEPDEISRIEMAHISARDILKYSPLVTDAYFHYTPSQIMLAALSIVDASLADMLIERSFPADAAHAAQSAETKARVLSTLAECREMLESEPPSRLNDYWGGAEARAAMRPLQRKLKKCRDPDRVNLLDLKNSGVRGQPKRQDSIE